MAIFRPCSDFNSTSRMHYIEHKSVGESRSKSQEDIAGGTSNRERVRESSPYRRRHQEINISVRLTSGASSDNSLANPLIPILLVRLVWNGRIQTRVAVPGIRWLLVVGLMALVFLSEMFPVVVCIIIVG